ncbi:G-type lectin S-receptor-like serine/threonine-protein kinase At1g11330 isoform X2 [Primulina tabacum]
MKFSTDLSTNEKNILTSWTSPSDPAPGRFTSTIEPLPIPQLFVWNGKYPYWRSGPWNGQIFIGIPGADTYYQNGFHLVNDNPLAAYLTITYTNVSILSYVVLNTSGVLIQKFWANGYQDWAVIWSSTGNECDVYGKCGPFGICESRSTPICFCLPGFEPKSREEWNAANWTSGCRRKSLLRCEKNSSVGYMGKEDGFLTMKTMKLPDNFSWFSTSEADCRNQCLNNCSCSGYAFDVGIGCLWWIGSFIDVQKFSSGGTNLYIRLASTELGHKKNLKAIISTVAVLGFIAFSVCTLLWWRLTYTGSKQIRGVTDPRYSNECVLEGVRIEELPLFTLGALSNATYQFDSANMLGQGGFGPVYKGKLSNGQEIAVKRLVRSSNQGLEEFVTEVEVISKLQHRNLVRILGCCVESEEKMLVYEYMPNGSLDGYIFDSQKQAFLDWKQRVIIIEGICRGLLYLHRDSRLRIIHRDLKASNILLDEDLNPKISDFGTARIFGGKEDQENTTRVIGTFGYMAPEYALRGRFSEKTDVYSFGVLLLEIVSGSKNSSFYHEEQELSLISYAWKLWNEEDMSSFMHPECPDPRVRKEILRYTQVGLLCVQETAKDRPNISTVLSMLSNEIVELPRPNHPAFTVNGSTAGTESTDRFATKSSSNGVTLTVVEGR